MAADDPLWGGLVVTTSNGNVVQNPLVSIANKSMHEMMRFAVELGMTPSSRMRIPAQSEQPKSKWTGLIPDL
jgi:P27 family predicted phage terminase small subunit